MCDAVKRKKAKARPTNNKLSKPSTEKRSKNYYSTARAAAGINRFDNKIADGFRNKLKADWKRMCVCVRAYADVSVTVSFLLSVCTLSVE